MRSKITVVICLVLLATLALVPLLAQDDAESRKERILGNILGRAVSPGVVKRRRVDRPLISLDECPVCVRIALQASPDQFGVFKSHRLISPLQTSSIGLTRRHTPPA